MTFAAHFAEHVTPKLRERCKVAAQLAVLLDDPSPFGKAFDDVWHFACSRGANFLPEDLHDALRDGLATTVCAELDAAEIVCERLAEEDRAWRSRDPVGYCEWLVAASSKPDQMRWILAGTCPAYREHLRTRADAAGTSFRARRERRLLLHQARSIRRAQLQESFDAGG